jgi:hypothetical protein
MEWKRGSCGKLLYARTFVNGDDTLEWAGGERAEMLAKGWKVAER